MSNPIFTPVPAARWVMPPKPAPIQQSNPLARGLVLYALFGSNPCDVVSGIPIVGEANVSEKAGTLYGDALYCNTTAGNAGAYMTKFPPLLATITTLHTIITAVGIDASSTSTNDYVFSVPYASSGFANPYTSLDFSAFGSFFGANQTGQCSYATNSSTFHYAATPASNYWVLDGRCRQYAVTRNGNASTFSIDGELFTNSPTYGDTSAIDWGAKQPPTFMDRSGTSVGAGFQGRLSFVAVWNRQLSAPEIQSFYLNPYQVF